MRYATIVAALALSAASAVAQPKRARATADATDGALAAPRPGASGEVVPLLGVSLGFSGTARDTLGALIESTTSGGAADRAGINPGNRLAELNGVSLRIDPADVGAPEATTVVMRRLARAMRDVRPGAEVKVRLFSGGRLAAMTVPTTGTPTAVQRAAESDTVPRASRAQAPTLPSVLAAMAELRAQLRRLAQSEEASPLVDTLMQVTLDLGALQRRLNALQPATPKAAPAPRDSGDQVVIAGLRVVPVTPEMADYFGVGSERGLLVAEADPSWSPLRKGDVIVRVNGDAVRVGALRIAADATSQTRLDILRDGRIVPVAVFPHE